MIFSLTKYHFFYGNIHNFNFLFLFEYMYVRLSIALLADNIYKQ